MTSHFELGGQGKPLCEVEFRMTRRNQVSHLNRWERSIPGSDENKSKSSEAEISLFIK